MGNIFGKDCPEPIHLLRKKTHNVRWKSLGSGSGSGGDASRPVSTGKARLDPKDFIVSGKRAELIVREPGSIGGQQFIIEECAGCDVYLLDHTAALTIDICTDCRIFTGPCESSIFIRDCKNCTFVVAAQQFRTRDCDGCTIFLFCATQPVIETSTQLRLACYTLDYFSLAGQFAAANLSVWNNKWSQVYNFSNPGEEHDWSRMPPGSHHREFTRVSLPEGVRQRAGFTDNTNGAVVPLTAGVHGLSKEEETCFVAVMADYIDAVLGKLLAVGDQPTMTSPQPQRTSRLLRTKLFHPQKAQCKSFFEDAPSSLSAQASSSSVLGMQWAGAGSEGTALDLLVAAGASKSTVSLAEGMVGGGYYAAKGSQASAAKAKVFFEQWDEDKG